MGAAALFRHLTKIATVRLCVFPSEPQLCAARHDASRAYPRAGMSAGPGAMRHPPTPRLRRTGRTEPRDKACLRPMRVTPPHAPCPPAPGGLHRWRWAPPRLCC